MWDFNARIQDKPSAVVGLYRYERMNRYMKNDNENGRRLIELCNGRRLVVLSGVVGIGEMTFESGVGRSNIAPIIIQEDELGRVVGMTVTDSLWDWCNTSHRLVMMKLDLGKANNERERNNVQTESKEEKKRQYTNKVAV